MSITTKPKRAFIAYCALAERLSKPGIGVMQALTPFLAEACQQFAGQLFDAGKFSDAVSERYGIRIPRLASLGLAEQLAREGLLTIVSANAKSTVYKYAEVPILLDASTSSPVTEAEVEIVLSSFVQFCRTDDRLKDRDDASLQASFLDRLLNVDSMRILGRREASISTKRSGSTLILPKSSNPSDQTDRAELHLDFLVSQFLLDMREKNAAGFDRVSDIAFANMAAEAIACIQEPLLIGSPLNNLTVYLDSPLLLDMLGVNTEYADYGNELLEAIRTSGANAAVLDHCVEEAEAAIHAQLNYLRSGINQVSVSWGTTAKPDLLAALSGCVGERAEKRLGISVERDPEANLFKRWPNAVGDIETAMEERMKAWRNDEAKDHDRKSVWAMLSIRDTSTPCKRICESKYLLLTRNTALVKISNTAWATWIKATTKFSNMHIESWTPISMSDKQFSGYLWARSGSGNGAMSRARLLAHCSAAVRPRADVKARAYNLVLELSGREEADDVAALLEDREGLRALMRATKGDPEDVTRERLPFILEKVKLAAGEFAAAAVLEESERQIEAERLLHQQELERLRDVSVASQAESDRQIREVNATLLQQQQDQAQLESKVSSLKKNLDAYAASECQRKQRIILEGFLAGKKIYRILRWAMPIFFGLASGLVSMLSTENPVLSAVLCTVLAGCGFWFVPNFLDSPMTAFAMKRMRAVIASRDANIRIREQYIAFHEESLNLAIVSELEN